MISLSSVSSVSKQPFIPAHTILVFGMVAGFLVSVFQAATQISDPALAFIPKMGAAVAGMVLFGHFMMNRIAAFTIHVISQIGNLHP